MACGSVTGDIKIDKHSGAHAAAHADPLGMHADLRALQWAVRNVAPPVDIDGAAPRSETQWGGALRAHLLRVARVLQTLPNVARQTDVKMNRCTSRASARPHAPSQPLGCAEDSPLLPPTPGALLPSKPLSSPPPVRAQPRHHPERDSDRFVCDCLSGRS